MTPLVLIKVFEKNAEIRQNGVISSANKPLSAMLSKHVSSEGGPILVADFEALRSWRGAFHDSGDYERACDALGSNSLVEIEVGDDQVLVWDIGGPGTAYLVWVSPEHVSIVRIWPDASWSSEECDEAVISAATDRCGTKELGRVNTN